MKKPVKKTTISHSEIVIDHGVVPTNGRKGRSGIYPFRALTVISDAMFIPLSNVGEGRSHAKESSLRALACYWGKKERWEDGIQRKYAVRYIKHQSGKYGYQITRIK